MNQTKLPTTTFVAHGNCPTGIKIALDNCDSIDEALKSWKSNVDCGSQLQFSPGYSYSWGCYCIKQGETCSPDGNSNWDLHDVKLTGAKKEQLYIGERHKPLQCVYNDHPLVDQVIQETFNTGSLDLGVHELVVRGSWEADCVPYSDGVSIAKIEVVDDWVEVNEAIPDYWSCRIGGHIFPRKYWTLREAKDACNIDPTCGAVFKPGQVWFLRSGIYINRYYYLEKLTRACHFCPAMGYNSGNKYYMIPDRQNEGKDTNDCIAKENIKLTKSHGAHNLQEGEGNAFIANGRSMPEGWMEVSGELEKLEHEKKPSNMWYVTLL
eukprot:UN25234